MIDDTVNRAIVSNQVSGVHMKDRKVRCFYHDFIGCNWSGQTLE